MTIPQATFRHARVCSVLALQGSSRAGRYDKYMATSPERAPMIAGALRSQRTHYGTQQNAKIHTSFLASDA